MKKILYFIFLLSLFVCGFEAKAQFYIFDNCSGTNPQFFFDGGAGYESGWLRLTHDQADRRGWVLLNPDFPSSMGATIEFEFKIWSNQNNKADGFCVFLIDATPGAPAFSIGGVGGFLGFSPPNASSAGATPTYLGVGIDGAAGNFSKRYGWLTGTSNEVKNAIAIRTGSMQPAGLKYHYLTGTAEGLGNGTVMAAANTSSRPADDSYFRKIRIIFEPKGAGINIKVFIKTTINGSFSQVLNYDYTNGAHFVPPPQRMRIGFAGTTGSWYARHEVDNILIRTPGILQVFKSMPECPKLNETAEIKTTVSCFTTTAQEIEVRDTLPLGYSYNTTPVLSGDGSFVISPVGSTIAADNRRVYTYKVSVNPFKSVTVTYDGMFTAMTPGGEFSTSAGLIKPANLPAEITDADLIMYAKHKGILKHIEAITPVGQVNYKQWISQSVSVNGGNLVWESSTNSGSTWEYAGTGSPFTPPEGLFDETSFNLRCVSGTGNCATSELNYLWTASIAPEITLADSCSLYPYLTVKFMHEAASCQWYTSPAEGTPNWVEINGATNRKLYITDDALYKVRLSYRGNTGDSRVLHCRVKKTLLNSGVRWYEVSSEYN